MRKRSRRKIDSVEEEETGERKGANADKTDDDDEKVWAVADLTDL